MDDSIKELAVTAFNQFMGKEILDEGNFLYYMGNYYLEVTHYSKITKGYIIGSVVVLALLIFAFAHFIKKIGFIKRLHWTKAKLILTLLLMEHHLEMMKYYFMKPWLSTELRVL